MGRRLRIALFVSLGACAAVAATLCLLGMAWPGSPPGGGEPLGSALWAWWSLVALALVSPHLLPLAALAASPVWLPALLVALWRMGVRPPGPW